VKGVDRCFLALVGGTLLLAALAYVMVVSRPAATYRLDDGPAAMTYNFLLARQQDDWARGYGYLSPSLVGYPPSVDQFTRNLQADEGSRLRYGDFAYEVEASHPMGMSTVEEVSIRETEFHANDLAQLRQSSRVYTVQWQLENGAWKIVFASTPSQFLLLCWTQKMGCK
jgi:hypothetical protein